MKTIEEIYAEIIANDDMKAVLAGALANGTVGDFLASYDVDGTVEEFAEYCANMGSETTAVSEEELAGVAGGMLISAHIPFDPANPNIGCQVPTSWGSGFEWHGIKFEGPCTIA